MLTIFLWVIIGLFVFSQVLPRILVKYFNYARPVAAVTGPILDSDFRRRLQPPQKIIERSGLKEGMRVLDLGCGSGTFTTFLARAVGDKGWVYALDIQPDMLKQLQEKLSRPENRDIKNIELINSSADELPFADGSLDLVCMVSVLQEIPDRQKALKEVKRVLKPGGVLAISEVLADIDYFLKSTTIKMATRAGFILDKALGGIWNYTVRFIKPQPIFGISPDNRGLKCT